MNTAQVAGCKTIHHSQASGNAFINSIAGLHFQSKLNSPPSARQVVPVRTAPPRRPTRTLSTCGQRQAACGALPCCTSEPQSPRPAVTTRSRSSLR
jgi:hypothetical protein